MIVDRLNRYGGGEQRGGSQLSRSARVTLALARVSDETILGVEPCPFLCSPALCECARRETKTDCKSRGSSESLCLCASALSQLSCVCACVCVFVCVWDPVSSV